MPNGYFILNLRKDIGSAFPEFALDGDGLYPQLKAKAEAVEDTTVVGSKKLYRADALNYAVNVVKENVQKFYSKAEGFLEKHNFSEKLSSFFTKLKAKFAPPLYTSTQFWGAWHDIGELTQWTSTASSVTSYELPTVDLHQYYNMRQFQPDVSQHPTLVANEGNCTPTAAANAMIYYNRRGHTKLLKNSSVMDTYDRIVEICGFAKVLVRDKYPENMLGIDQTNILASMKKYAQEQGCPIVVNTYWYNFYSDYVKDIKAGRLIYLSVNTLSDWHSALAYGCTEIKGSFGTKRVLMVLDGWYKNVKRYMDFNPTSLLSIRGHSVWVK